MMINELSPLGVRLSQKDLEALRKKLWVEAQKLRRTAALSPELARTARMYARSIAPRDRGYAIRSIQWKTDNKDQAEIWISKTILNENPSNTQKFNYVKHMHLTNGVMGRGKEITSGDPQFMFTTRDYIFDVMRERIKINLGR